MKRKNLLLALPILSFFWLASTIVIAGHFYPGYSHITQFMSELGATDSPYGPYVNYLGFIPTELFLLSFVFVSYSVLPKTKQNIVGLIFIAVYCISLVVAAFFPCDFECRPVNPTLSHDIHMLSAFPAYLCGSIAVFIISSGSSLWMQTKAFKVVSFVIGIMCIYSFLKIDPNSNMVGAYQRLLELLLYSWFIYLGYSLRKYTRDEAMKLD